MKIDAFLRYLNSEKRYSIKTAQSYERDLLQFSDFIQAEFQLEDLAQARNPQVRSWIVQLVNQQQQPTSVRRKLSALKSFYKYAMKKGWVKTNPAEKVNTPKIAERLPKYVEQKNLARLLDQPGSYFTDNYEGLREKLIIDVLYSTGMRRQELINMQWSHINLSAKQIKILGKGNKERLVPVSDHLISALKNFRQKSKERSVNPHDLPFVFLTDEGQQIYPNLVYRIVKKYISLCSTVDKKSPHVLRHSFATHMSNNGAKLNDIKELMGHASLASTQVYTHNTIEQLKEIYKIAHPKA
jgi:integrase/recombinase XerC